MRIYPNFTEALGEIRRDLAEMGVRVHTQTMQDKDISGDASYETLELQNFMYTVTDPDIAELVGRDQDWIELEWEDRFDGIMGRPSNPGNAYHVRSTVWDEFLHEGRFAYTYSERLARHNQVRRVINRLRDDHYSRQLYIAMWHPDDSEKLGVERVPCSLGWHVQFRGGRLDLTYFMRSCDFFTHFQNDVALAIKLQRYIADEVGMEPGHFTHFMSSLHVYQKDVADTF